MANQILGHNGEDQKFTLMVSMWIQNNFSDSFFGQNPFFYKLKETGRVLPGGWGTDFTLPIMHPVVAGNVAQGVSDAWAARTHQPTQGWTRGRFQMAEYFMPISIADRDIKSTKGSTGRMAVPESMLKINLNRFTEQVRIDFNKPEHDPLSVGTAEQLMSWRTLYNKGGSLSTGLGTPAPHLGQLSTSDAVWGNAASVTGQTANTQYTIGGLNRNAPNGAYFNCIVKQPTSAETLSIDTINNAISFGTRGTDRPDLFVLSQEHFDKVLSIIQLQQRFEDSKMANMFGSFRWRGCDFVMDDDMGILTPGKNLLAVNTQAVSLYCDSDTPSIKATEVDDRPIQAWKASWFVQLIPTLLGRGMGYRHVKVA